MPLQDLLPGIAARAAALDAAAAFPHEDVAALRSAGLLAAPLPRAAGGHGLGTEPDGADAAFALLRQLGQANLSVARLVEAHVNVVRLVVRFGTPDQLARVAAICGAGELIGLWVTDAPGQVLRLAGGVLRGSKGPGSGAGHLRHALVTLHDGDDVRMALLPLRGDEPVTPVGSRLLGMRASANGTVGLDGVALPPLALVGAPGDYLREPDFSTGAWRTMAATLGGMDALLDAVREQLRARRHDMFPLQQARFGEMAIAGEAARLWTAEAARRAEHGIGTVADQVAYVNLARIAVETACFELIRHAQRALGLAALVQPNPVERLLRDLLTYLRQPAPDLVLTEAAAHGLRGVIRAAEALAAMARLPVGPLDALLRHGTLLVLAPHPDDESLGCGGLIAACCARGVPPHVLVVTDGAASHPRSRAYPPARLAALRQGEARDAVAALGLPPDRIGFLGLPDTRSPLDDPALESAATAVAAAVRACAIGTILASWEHDPHCDHLSTHRIAVRAAALTGVRHLAYPVWGWTLPPETPLPGVPTGMRIDIAAHLPAKRRAIAAHRSQAGGLITDDPGAFRLPPDFLRFFDGRYETVLEPGGNTGP